MKSFLRFSLLAALIASLSVAGLAQQKKSSIVEGAELKQIVPTNYFFEGQVAPVQMRNSVAIHLNADHLVVAGLVDNSGYSSDLAQKYQGFFINEQKIKIENATLAPGEYGFGFTKDGKFHILDVGGNEVVTVPFHEDETLTRPVPLKVTEESGAYRLYAGRKYVTLKAE